MDITDVILHQHGEQRRMFAMLDEIRHTDTETLAAVWKRLEILLETHAEAEERFFYPRLLKIGKGAADADDAAEEVEDAIKDHNEIREAIRDVAKHHAGSDAWWKAVIDCRIANSDHMAEEERQDLADFRTQTDLRTRHEIAIDFLRFESQRAASGVEPKDKEPEQYVADNS